MTTWRAVPSGRPLHSQTTDEPPSGAGVAQASWMPSRCGGSVVGGAVVGGSVVGGSVRGGSVVGGSVRGSDLGGSVVGGAVVGGAVLVVVASCRSRRSVVVVVGAAGLGGSVVA